MTALYTRLQQRWVPELQFSQGQYEEHLHRLAAGATRWLDLGCGHRLLPEWREAAERELVGDGSRIVGVDPDFDALRRHRSLRQRVRADAGTLPFPDASFDLVTANMVVEHLGDPARQFAEIARVLRPGGRLLFITPNAHGYIVPALRILPDSLKRVLARLMEGRAEADVYPTFYRANTAGDIARIARGTGLEVESVLPIVTVPATFRIPPLAIAELLLIRQLRRPSLARFGPVLIATLRRPPAAA